MAHLHTTLARALVLASLAATLHASAQTTLGSVEAITVSGKSAPILEPERIDVSGFNAAPIRSLAQSLTVFSKDALIESALTSLSQLTRLDASLTDAYNTTGYNQSVSVRGFTLDNTYNFRRDGLPVLNIGPLALENKAQIEVLKGVSGLLSGVSAPGGLVNATSLRAGRERVVSATIGASERAGVSGSAVFATKIDGIGLRLDVSAQTLRPMVDNANGQRQFASAAVDVPISRTTSLSFDLETQRFSQPSVPGVSPLDSNGDGIGDTLPRIQPRLNLNAFPWTQPFQTQSNLAAVKLTHAFSTSWSIHAAAQTQRVRTNDRTAFPDGCSNDPIYVYPGFCANGDYDLYDFRSENERRRLNVYDVHTIFSHRLGTATATVTVGALRRVFTQRTQNQAYNYAGSGNLYAAIPNLAPAADALTAGTQLDERNEELYGNVHFAIGSSAHLFAGVRSSHLDRTSVRTDGAERTSIGQSITTPWLGASLALSPTLNAYASWGQGAESEVVPNRPAQYANFGAALPVLKSEQTEVGLKWNVAPRLLLTASAFQIEKPYGDDLIGINGLSTRIAGEKQARHRGFELAAIGRITPHWSMQASVAYLDAVYTRALNDSLVGSRVTNIPKRAGSIFLDHQSPWINGLAFNALLSAQGRKAVLADNTLHIPGQSQLDLGVRYVLPRSGSQITWRGNVENVTNRSGWREASTQPWGGIYLFPTPARAFRASVTIAW